MPIPPIPAGTRGATYHDCMQINDRKALIEVWKVPVTSVYKGKVIFCHGLGEDSSLYGQFFETLSNQGYEVFFYSQRLKLSDTASTIGSVVKVPKDYLKRTSSQEEYNNLDIADLDKVIRYNLDERQNKTEKFYLMGNGHGSMLIIFYAMMGNYQDWIKSVVTISPTVELHPRSLPNVLVRQATPLLTKVTPNFTVYHRINYDYMTSDPSWGKYFQELYKEKVRVQVKQFNQMMVRCSFLLSEAFARRFNPDISLFVVHGTDDFINSVEGTKKWYGLLGNNIEKDIMIVENARHMLINETPDISQRVTSAVVDFMNEYASDKHGSAYNSYGSN